MKFVWQISYLPVNSASLGSYFCVKNSKISCFWSKNQLTESCKLFSNGFWFWLAHSVLPVLRQLGSKFVTDRQTDRQTNSLTPFRGVCRFFLSVKFTTSLLTLLASGRGINSLKIENNKHGHGLNTRQSSKVWLVLL